MNFSPVVAFVLAVETIVEFPAHVAYVTVFLPTSAGLVYLLLRAVSDRDARLVVLQTLAIGAVVGFPMWWIEVWLLDLGSTVSFVPARIALESTLLGALPAETVKFLIVYLRVWSGLRASRGRSLLAASAATATGYAAMNNTAWLVWTFDSGEVYDAWLIADLMSMFFYLLLTAVVGTVMGMFFVLADRHPAVARKFLLAAAAIPFVIQSVDYVLWTVLRYWPGDVLLLYAIQVSLTLCVVCGHWAWRLSVTLRNQGPTSVFPPARR